MRQPTRLRCESLEARDVPATWTVTTPEELIARMTQANTEAGDDTIVLVADTTYTLTATHNTTYGPTGLPVVKANLPDGVTRSGSLTIVGNGATIQRSPTAGTPDLPDFFRLLAVENGATLTAADLTLQNGRLVDGSGPPVGRGGAVLNLGTLSLTDVVVRSNAAIGNPLYNGGPAAGGGIYSTGTLTVERGTITGNQAIGAAGSRGQVIDSGRRLVFASPGGDGGDGLGGGLYVGGGTATLRGVTVSGNTAAGGRGGDGLMAGSSRGRRYDASSGGDGGDGLGGGLHAAGGTTTLYGVSVTGNAATAGAAGFKGSGRGTATNGVAGTGLGGGTFVGPGVAADWDAATGVTGNTATSNDRRDVYRA